MTRLMRVSAAALLLAGGGSAAQAATVFNMDGVASGSYSQLVLNEGAVTLTVRTANDPAGMINAGAPSVALLGARSIVGNASAGGFGALDYSFNTSIDSITFAFGDAGGDDDTPVVIAAFDAAGVLLGSLSETYPGGYALGKTLTLNFAGARSFVVSSPNQINPHSVYSEISAYAVGGAVPEPSTWAMLILGFGLVGGALRSARAKTGRKQLAVTYA